MLTSLFSRHEDDRPTTQRRRPRRSPIVEDLEGRRLLSGIVGNHIGTRAADVQVEHVVTDGVLRQGGHLGMSAAEVQGGHVGSAPNIIAIL